MEPPVPLDTLAQGFWDRHAERLTVAGVLTDADLDSFAVLCQTWEKVQILQASAPGAEHYREMVQLGKFLKEYQSLARSFGLLPRERKQAKMVTNPPPAKDEFGL